MSKCIIIASMPVKSEYLQKAVSRAAFVITADAGWLQAKQANIQVQMALGDFDSSQKPSSSFCDTIIQLPAQKDDTDTHFAVKKAIEMGFTQIDVVGGLGGRLSHTQANLATQLYATKQGVTLRLLNEYTTIYCCAPGILCLKKENTQYISVFPAQTQVTGLTLEGLKYPLNKFTLHSDYPIGCSNEFIQQTCTISHKTGYLRIILEEKI